MGICSSEHYWITCDHPGCAAIDDGPESESMEAAIDYAMEGEWESHGGDYYCPEHAAAHREGG